MNIIDKFSDALDIEIYEHEGKVVFSQYLDRFNNRELKLTRKDVEELLKELLE